MLNKDSPPARQKAIVELIQAFAISDHKQLIELLLKHHTIKTNQAVISRDLRKLGVIKKVINGNQVYEMPEVNITAEILRLALITIDHNESMIVIKTHPGLADFVGDCVDRHTDLDILGSLAGENVVFVVPKSIQNIHKTYKALCEKLHFKQTGLQKDV